MASIINEITQLRRPVLGAVLRVPVPPFLFIPSVELDEASFSDPPGENLEASIEDHHAKSVSHVAIDVATCLSATNHEGNEDPEDEDPADWNEPGERSVIELLHDAVVGLDVGKEPEEAENSERASKTAFRGTPGLPVTLGEKPFATVPSGSQSEEDN